MDLVKTQYERIRRQLEGLTASQRMLTIALLVIMGITLVYWVRYAGRPEMDTLLDQPMGLEELTRIGNKLDALRVNYQLAGDRILVPTDQRDKLLSALYFDQALPANTSAGLDALLAKISPWNSDKTNEQWWLREKQAKLAGMIKSWPGVADATVMIDPTQRRGFGPNAQVPSATVDIRTRDGRRTDKKLVEAAANMVAGSHSSLANGGKIFVTLNGMPATTRGSDGAAGIAAADDLLDLRRQWEAHYSEVILRQLAWMDARVIATAAVDINVKSTQEVSTTFDPKGTAKVERSIRSKTNEEATTAAPSGEPGVGANTQMTLAEMGGGAAAGQSRNEMEEETEYESGLSRRETSTRELPGRATVLGASVRVPQSYFVRLYKVANPGSKEPDAAALAPLLEQELPRIRDEVRTCLALSDEDAVTIATYTDSDPAPQGEVVQAAMMPTGPLGSVTGHAKEIALGALAVVSLLMMTMMVRKGTPAPVVAHVPEPQGPVPQLANGEEVIGEAGDGEAVLGGMELDEAAAQTQQMLGQVSDLVKENPEAAANLIKRWMNK